MLSIVSYDLHSKVPKVLVIIESLNIYSSMTTTLPLSADNDCVVLLNIMIESPRKSE